MIAGRGADFVLFVVTVVELGILFVLVPRFTATDWVYVAQHILVLGIALTRHPPRAQDRSPASTVAVVVSYAYPYAQVALLRWGTGYVVWPTVGLLLVTVAAGLSLASLLTLGRGFGFRPALRRRATTGPYRLVRHPIYLAYFLARGLGLARVSSPGGGADPVAGRGVDRLPRLNAIPAHPGALVGDRYRSR